jgi:hypothetical protein
LDERQRHLLLAAEANEWGRDGVSGLSSATGARSTIPAGMRELVDESDETLLSGRTRRPGAGGKKATISDPGLVAAIETLVEPNVRSDPESPLRWTLKSTRNLTGSYGMPPPRPAHQRTALPEVATDILSLS